MTDSDAHQEGNQLSHTDACLSYAAKERRLLCETVPNDCTAEVLPLRHLDICARYAAKTGYPYCIAECADARRDLEEQAQEQPGGDVPARGPHRDSPHDQGRPRPPYPGSHWGTPNYVVGGPRSNDLKSWGPTPVPTPPSNIRSADDAAGSRETTMTQVTVPLSEAAEAALKRIADEDFRTPELQASLLLERILGLRPLDPKDTDRLVAANGDILQDVTEDDTCNDDPLDGLSRGIEELFDAIGGAISTKTKSLRDEVEKRRKEAEAKRTSGGTGTPGGGEKAG